MAMKRGDGDDADLVKLYLRDIGRYPLLTKDDEARLAQAIEAGHEAAAALAGDAFGAHGQGLRKRPQNSAVSESPSQGRRRHLYRPGRTRLARA